jgi:hypothetical protein
MWRDWALFIMKFSIALSIADLALVIVLVGSGINVTPQLYFAPNIAGNPFINALAKFAAESSNNYMHIDVIYFFYYVIPYGLLFAISNLGFGILAGFPIMVWNIANLLNAPLPDTIAFLSMAIAFQSLTWVYLIDSLIGWLFIGRTMHGEAGE